MRSWGEDEMKSIRKAKRENTYWKKKKKDKNSIVMDQNTVSVSCLCIGGLKDRTKVVL